MTKIQRMEARIKKDDKMCERINEILDALDKGEEPYKGNYPYSLGAIRSCLETAGRRAKED